MRTNLKHNFFILLLVALTAMQFPLQAQTQKPKGIKKVVKGTEKMNTNTREVNEQTAEMNNQVQEANANVKTSVDNVKAIIQVFEPIRRLHLRKKNVGNNEGNGASDQSSNQQSGETGDTGGSYTESTDNSAVYETESTEYNTDGTANLGSQNHKEFGCYIDITQGLIMDEVDAADKTSSVDIIFTATDYYGSAPMYALLTPAYVKNDFFANYYFRGTKYKDANIPVKQWEEVNESEVALTSLSPAQFEKIQNNNQLMAVVKKTTGFKEKYESRSKIEGKVFAIKTEMGNRTAYGLMYVMNHYGTTGSNGYLKIKLKVTGFDSNSDGYPDPSMYTE
jgi:hypothetical protein